ncbi:helix-turn-helix domain-containing protein [Cohnella faecalis]|nr:AraC family transcriptional regulator [Cohnella faecalis]
METNFYEAQNFDISREKKYQSSMPTQHYHNGFEIFYLVAGDVCYFINDKAYQVVGGVMLLIDVDEIHKLVNFSGDTFERITLVFKREFIEGIFPGNHSFDVLSCFLKDRHMLTFSGYEQSFIEKLFDKMISEFTKQPPGYEFYLKTLLFELLIFIYRHLESSQTKAYSEENNIVNRKIFDIVDFLNRNYDKQHTIRDISSRFFISPSYFCKSFRDSTGFTFTEYLNNVRIKEARVLLTQTGMKVADVAEKVGFENLTHFGRVFKEITGLSPLKYRQANRVNPAS